MRSPQKSKACKYMYVDYFGVVAQDISGYFHILGYFLWRMYVTHVPQASHIKDVVLTSILFLSLSYFDRDLALEISNHCSRLSRWTRMREGTFIKG